MTCLSWPSSALALKWASPISLAVSHTGLITASSSSVAVIGQSCSLQPDTSILPIKPFDILTPGPS